MVKKKYFFLLVVCLCSCYSLVAQQTTTVEKLPSSVNTEAEETFPLLDVMHNRLYFSRILHPENKGGKYSGSDIWYLDMTVKEAIPRKEAVDNLNDKKNNFVVGINTTEDILYLNHPKSAEKGFQFSKELDNKWGSPETIEIPGLPLIGYRGLYVSPDYQEIIISMEGNDTQGAEDLYISHRNESGDWSKPTNLGVTINTTGREISPFLSNDKRKLYFASDGHDGRGGMDIFEVERLYDSWNVWGKLRNLGPSINSSKFDAYYSAYGDTLAFFSSNRDSEFADIYKVMFKQKLRTDNQSLSFVPISSVSSRDTRNYLSNQAMKDELEYSNSPNIPIYNTNQIDENELLTSKLYIIALKLKENPELKLSLHFEPNKALERGQIVAASSQIILLIYKNLIELGIQKERMFFDGIVNNNELESYKNTVQYLIGINYFR
ncbi:MAG: hypothetical protein ACI83B_000261 [Sediminicola sp.]|jgi:hypothetical protein